MSQLRCGPAFLLYVRGRDDSTADTCRTSFTLTLRVPANTHGTVCVPKLGAATATISVDGKPVAGYVDSDYICVDGVTGSSAPHVISRSA